MLGLDSPSHWVVLLVVVALLFGYKKLPDAARSVGRSLRIFKTEIKGLSEDDKAREAARESTTSLLKPASDVPSAAAVAPPAPAATDSSVPPNAVAPASAAAQQVEVPQARTDPPGA
jgi:sec-independent protein translocase protein TatA